MQSAVDEKAMGQMKLDNARDLERCRNLLVEMDEDALRDILGRSRYNIGGKRSEIDEQIAANKVVDDKWLEEAARAFAVPTRYIKLQPGDKSKTRLVRRQADVVEDVLSKVRQAKKALRERLQIEMLGGGTS